MMRYLVLLLLLAVVFQWMSTPASTTPLLDTLPWQGQTLAMHGDVGEYSALALDGNGRPHIIYYERAIDTQLVYGYWDGLIWRFENVPFSMPEQNSYQPGLALSVDQAGMVHLAYYHNQHQALYYGRRDAGGWSGGVVDNAGNVGRYLSLKTAQNTPQISYYDTTNQDLKYAQWNGSDWQIEVVDSAGNVGEYNSLAIDSAGRPRISYYDATNQALKYAHLNVTWHLETVPTGGSAGRGTSLALDWLDQPHIAYVYSAPGGFQLHYARKNGSAWSSEVVSTLNVGSVSLALGPDNVAHIAYDVLGRYLYHADNHMGSWEITAVDTTSEDAINPSLAVDTAGRPHLSYYLTDFGDLRYSTQAEQWRIETVDPSINSNGYITMAYDSDGSPHLSYSNGGFLAFTDWNGTNWGAENVLPTAVDPRYSSLVYDAQGRPHLAFYQHTSGDLFYAVQNSATWSVFPVDSSGDVGQYTRLMLTAEGTPVIVYWDHTNYRVKVAALVNGGWIYGTHTAAPPLNADSGHLSAGLAYDGAVYISYYDAPNTDLRVATARLNGTSWTWQDELLGITEGHTGPANDLAMTADMYFPTLAYEYSDTAGNRALRYATRPPGSAWSSTQFRPLGGNSITGLGLSLRAGNANTPRVAYILNEASQKTLWLASNNGFTWTFESLAAVAVSNVTHWPRPVVLANGVDRVAFVDGASLRLASRATTQERPFVSADRTAYMPNAEAFGLCLCFLLQCLDWETAKIGPLSLAGGPGLTQAEIFHQMGALFSATEGGRYYMDLYQEHGLEIYAVMTQRPALLWDSYRTLHELMPGLEALVTGRGDEVLITSSIIAHTYDVWLSLSLFGSPELRSAIQAELARTNNLQDFYGMTFNEWALAIGVQPPEGLKVYLPVVHR